MTDVIKRPQSAPWLDEVIIRPLAESDLPALEWEGAYTHFRRVYAQIYQRAVAGRACLWLAQDAEGLVLGQLFVLLRSLADDAIADGQTRAFIHSFRVRPEYRRRGLGSRLLAHAEGDLMARGFEQVSLHVARDNAGGLRFYQRHGYQQVGASDGRWSYEDHEGRTRQMYEPSWRMRKLFI
jgi:ribosomal protein S18 acetylase RimI-like enzyme